MYQHTVNTFSQIALAKNYPLEQVAQVTRQLRQRLLVLDQLGLDAPYAVQTAVKAHIELLTGQDTWVLCPNYVA